MSGPFWSRGRWPRVNVLLVDETDFADVIHDDGTKQKSAPQALATLRLHMDVELLTAEASQLQKLLVTGGNLGAAHKIVEVAMARVVAAKDPVGRRGRRFMAAAFSQPTSQFTPMGRWPRVNFIIARDYVDTVAIGTGAPAATLSVHLDIPVLKSEAKAMRSALNKQPPAWSTAHTLAEKAMSRDVKKGAPEGKRGRALIAATFAK